MTDQPHRERHPFLDDLAPDAILTSTILRLPLIGREQIREVVPAIGSRYARQTPWFRTSEGKRSVIGYEAPLTTGGAVTGVVIVDRNESDLVQSVTILFSPLDGAIELANGARDLLSDTLGAEYFL